jgi:hypothetical protein
MNPRYVAILAIALLSACNPAVQNPDDPVTVTVNPALVPGTATTPGPGGETLRVAASRDAKGIQTDFVEGIVLVRASSRDELKPFLDRYQGVVLGDDTIPEPPPELGITLTPEQRKPTEFIVRINLATVDTSAFEINATVAGLTGMLEFSSESGFQTLAGVADAVAAGFDASPDYVDYKQQFPAPLLSTEERSNGAGGWNDALTTARFAETGSESRVALAWQFVSAHGIERFLAQPERHAARQRQRPARQSGPVRLSQ